ncbi:AMP-binding protein [Streptomyces sp. NPDC004609]|uniref:AMP-binding protein n=1 Tax=Streptomyces sp. NPDC004609 TaxID=3364704 RepID=UPI0036AC8359
MSSEESGFESFVGALRRRAGDTPAHTAVRYWTAQGEEELSYAELDRAARAGARRLAEDVAPGGRVLLACGPGTGFVRGFVACLYAGAVPVPVPVPGGFGRQESRTAAIARDTGARLVLTDEASLPAVSGWLKRERAEPPGPAKVPELPAPPGVPEPAGASESAAFAGLPVLTVESAEREGGPDGWRERPVRPGALCFLQYTSGSTSDPKGVMVPHGALVHNIRLMRDCHGWHGGMTWCSWLPAYHDMGLIAMTLTPLYVGGTAVLMSATDFLKRPVSWLRLIERHGAEISCAPNFAYELCARRLTEEQTAGLDLTRWRYACNGAEPVNPATLTRFARRFHGHGFAPKALLPGYGLAEATLFVSGARADRPPTVLRADPAALGRGELTPAGEGARGQEVASSGIVRGLDVRIVDPRTSAEVPDGTVGEIWIRGESVALGYWNRPEETARTFRAATAAGEDGFLRTGDLGVLRDGELYVTGRIKEMIIVHGRNLYPHDIEHTLSELSPSFAALPAAVFPVRPDGGQGPEEIVAVQELRARGLTARELTALARTARTRLAQRLGVGVGGLVLVRVGRIRRTTSGKIQRSLMRTLFENDELEPLHEELSAKVTAAFRTGAAEGSAPRRPAAGGEPGPALAVPADRRSGALGTALEDALGDPRDARRAFSFRRCAELDRAEVFPAGICRELDALGVPRWFVPERHGGELRGGEDLLEIIRTLGRRDFTVALGHVKTYLGAVSVWVAGTPAQAAALGARVVDGAVVSLALTEQAHGSDLLAGDLTAVPTEDGWRLDGEKWLINNATRAGLVCVLARTRPEGGARGFSLFLVDKSALVPGSWRPLGRVPTHGVRGADISGIAFDGAELGRDALIGAEGSGLETILKGFQITRTLCSAMSLGMVDQALRTAVDFARTHRLYNRPLAELPEAARTLAEAYADLLAMEAVALVATRSVHTLTGEQSAVSAVVKYLVPTLGDEVVGALRGLLGARAMLVTDHAHGLFQKIERDHRIVGIFDGSTAVNLHALINQFPVLARGFRRRLADEDGVARAARLDRPPPELDHGRLTLHSRTGSSVVQSLPRALERLRAAGVPAATAARAGHLAALADVLHEEMAAHRHTAREVPESAFALARRYALVYAGAASLHLWLENRGTAVAGGPPWSGTVWLDAVLVRLIGRLTGEPDLDDTEGPALDALLHALHTQHGSGLLFSLLHSPLAEGPVPAAGPAGSAAGADTEEAA